MLAEINGSIQVATANGGFDSNGNPKAMNWSYGEKIPCHYEANTFEHSGIYEGGTFTKASFRILIEINLAFDAQYIVLNDINGDRIQKEFRVQNVEHRTIVGNTRITI